MTTTKIAFVGTGFVADYYMTTLVNHSNLELVGVWDRDQARLEQFCTYYKIKSYQSLQALMADETVIIIVNLTTPESHFDINLQALRAGKHVYCEKPLSMQFEQAELLNQIAEQNGLSLHCAPANALSPAFVETTKLIREGHIGKPGFAMAQMEDGPVFWDNWQEWRSVSGAVWPGISEFKIGSTIEHAGYAISWLVALFGAVQHLSAISSTVFKDKGAGTENLELGPDHSVGIMKFSDNVSARLTCGLAQERDRTMTIIGDKGVLTVRDLWDWCSPIDLTTASSRMPISSRLANKVERMRGQTLPLQMTTGATVEYKPPNSDKKLPPYPSRINFCGGIAAQANAISEMRHGFFSGQVAVHMSEIILAINAGCDDYRPKTAISSMQQIGSNSLSGQNPLNDADSKRTVTDRH